MPGHEPSFGGAEYRDIKERDLNVDLALALTQDLVEDGHYEVVMTRDKDVWNPYLETFFSTNAEEIKIFVVTQKKEMATLVEAGRITIKDNNIPHNDAPTDVALRLFAINKWANEHNVDIIIHIHFNDSSPRKIDQPGKYNGFTIYAPERQYSNAEPSGDIATSIFKRLSLMFPVSNLPGEDAGVVEDQELIALGSSNTVDAASVLLEYGYIYEPQFQTSAVRKMMIRELAFQTYLGISDFLGSKSLMVGPEESTFLPYREKDITTINSTIPNPQVLLVQAALSRKGFYPPKNYSRNDCPTTGVLGACTKTAVEDFQKKYMIKGEKGTIGPKTRAELRKLFDANLMTKS